MADEATGSVEVTGTPLMNGSVSIIDTSTDEEFIFPINPLDISLKDSSTFYEYSVMELGSVKIPAGVELTEVSMSGILPGAKRGRASFIIAQVDPAEVRDMWNMWMEEKIKLRMVIGGTNFDDAVYLDSFSCSLSGSFGDYNYEATFVKAKDIIIPTVIGDPDGNGNGSDRESPTETIPLTYITQKGDTLYKIAKKFYKKGKYWKQIYELNENLIKKKKAKLPGGLVLQLPLITTIQRIEVIEEIDIEEIDE